MTAEVPVDAAGGPIRKDEAKALLSRFTQIQMEERKLLRRQQQDEMDRLVRDQRRLSREWQKQSSKHLIEFRHSHRGQGSLVRAEVKNETSKREVFRRELADIKKKVREHHEASLRTLKSFQETNLRLFKAHTDRGLRPPDSLWSSTPTPQLPPGTPPQD